MIEPAWIITCALCGIGIAAFVLLIAFALCKISQKSDELEIQQEFFRMRMAEIEREADEINRDRSK